MLKKKGESKMREVTKEDLENPSKEELAAKILKEISEAFFKVLVDTHLMSINTWQAERWFNLEIKTLEMKGIEDDSSKRKLTIEAIEGILRQAFAVVDSLQKNLH